MLDKIRQLERILDPSENDYLSALRERIHPIKGKASLGEDLYSSSGYGDGFGDGFGFGNANGNGSGYDLYSSSGYGDGYGYGNGNGNGFGEYLDGDGQ